MKTITALTAYTFVAITVLGLLVFPIFIIMEFRGNPVLTRSHPEDT
jgi:hypothetical protein